MVNFEITTCQKAVHICIEISLLANISKIYNGILVALFRFFYATSY